MYLPNWLEIIHSNIFDDKGKTLTGRKFVLSVRSSFLMYGCGICIFPSDWEFSINRRMTYTDSQFIKRKMRFLQYIYWYFTPRCFICRKISNYCLYLICSGNSKWKIALNFVLFLNFYDTWMISKFTNYGINIIQSFADLFIRKFI